MRTAGFYAFIVIVLATGSAFGAIVEVDVVSVPVIDHYFFPTEYEPGTDIVIYEAHVIDEVLIPLPEVYLEPGDIARYNISFADNKKLAIINNTPLFRGFFDFHTLDPPSSGGMSYTADSMISWDIIKSENFNTTFQSRSIDFITESGGDYHFDTSMGFLTENGDYLDGAIVEEFVIEFQAPTIVGGEAFQAFDYVNNFLVLQTYYNDAPYDMNTLEIIPEPCTLLLLGFGGFVLRRRGGRRTGKKLNSQHSTRNVQ